jgi:multidrug efflux system outer membrane protein
MTRIRRPMNNTATIAVLSLRQMPPGPGARRERTATSGGRHSPRSLLLFLTLVFLIAGCAVGPNYKRPDVAVPTNFRTAEGVGQQISVADLPWWEVFKDQKLKELVQTALVNNYDIRAAVSRVEQARQIAAQARAQFFPFVDYGVTASDGKNEFVGGVVPNGGTTRSAFAAATTVAWEVDIWGRVRRLNESARAQYLSTEQARRGVLLSLVSDVAQAYFELLDLELQLDIAKRTTDSFTNTLTLFTQRLEGGVASKLDTSRAGAALATAAASIPELEREIVLKENQISVLLGHNPAEIPHNSKLLAQLMPPNIPVGLPSALLERRPDVLEAEQLMRAANAQIGVATAAYFPRIGLTALLGRASSPLDEITSGQATVWGVAGNAAGPIFHAGALKAQKRQTVAFWEQTKLQYEQTALNAFQDVSNALISRQKYEAIRAKQTQAVEAYQESVTVSLQRYIAGKASYYEVLEAQQQLFPAENALAVTELNRRTVIVQLYKALGGGWNLKDPDWVGPKSSSQATNP